VHVFVSRIYRSLRIGTAQFVDGRCQTSDPEQVAQLRKFATEPEYVTAYGVVDETPEPVAPRLPAKQAGVEKWRDHALVVDPDNAEAIKTMEKDALVAKYGG